ncbi:hypothetical protein [Paucibacter soli]|uniref:hypothetical protein n=1 Tax=Paucibacter soli TaxID=3133433 RepID=UPI0030A3AB1B
MDRRINEEKVIWATLSDEALARMGAKDSVSSANSAILAELRAWHIPSDYGIIIADPSVLLPVWTDGVHYTAEMSQWHERVATGREPKASTADRLACAMELLYIASRKDGRVNADVADSAQRIVSDILIRYPVFLHPRLLIGSPEGLSRFSGDSHTVLTHMIRTRICEMPSVRHGCDPAGVEAFAKSALSRAPFQRSTLSRGVVTHPSRDGSKKVFHQGAGLESAVRAYGEPCPGFIGSMLELEALRGPVDGKLPVYFSHVDSRAETWTFRALCMAQGMWQHTLSNGDALEQSPRSAWFSDALLASKVLSNSQILIEAYRCMTREAVVQWAGLRKGNEVGPTEAMVFENVRLGLGALVKVGLAEDVGQAAGKLFEYLADDRKYGTFPESNTAGAMGFMRGLVEAGFKLPDSLPPLRMGDRNSAPCRSNADRWAHALEVWSRTQIMQTAIEASSHGDSTANEGAAPARRRVRAL